MYRKRDDHVTLQFIVGTNHLVRMDIRPKERGDRGRTLPTTVRMTAVMLLDTDRRLAKDGMQVGGFIPVFLERVSTGGADMHIMVNQDGLLR